jgi:Na+/H+-dicarboxylate symporter
MFKLSKFWKLYVAAYVVCLIVLVAGPILGLRETLTGSQWQMWLYVPISFFIIGNLPFKLPTRILIGLLLGGVGGLLIGPDIKIFEFIGTIFIRLIFMVIVPLVFASLFSGTQSMGDIRKMGRVGFKTIFFYVTYTIIGASIGLILANSFRPGEGLSKESQEKLMASYGQTVQEKVTTIQKPSFKDTIVNIVPKNPFHAMSLDPPDMLGLIFFAIFMGVAITFIGEDRRKIVVTFFDGIFDAMLAIVQVVIQIAPYGVFALIASVVGQFGVGMLIVLIKYTLVVLGGLAILWISYFPVTHFLTPINLFGFIKSIRQVMIVGFSTSSSAATLPIMLETCNKKLGAHASICNFMLPLSITVNMNGTALYQAVATVFIAQVYGINLSVVDQILIVIMATLAAIGAAGVPSAGIMMLVMILQVINIPPEGIALIWGVDRLLDMVRTMVNVTGDCTAVSCVARWENELNPPAEILKNK